ncbi:MAG: regulatory iron-sulfur-containing complex subunit RicT [Salinivirgaceae bacterium]|nr:regulatory iron-sulfur-containing complex subunit RicT [Salinivirgaceae bacterium]MDD4746554.1 regulatory iron-sulfur-containing complex subunit RicT [Salinivirgaceae bacterium]MDY0279622.1 regulatory iron-sulfur-containing complex subunit RicT [Salinivirgaceae bacterium]
MDSDIFDKTNIPHPEENPNRPKFTGNFAKLNVHNWLYNKPTITPEKEIVEIKFKNTRKGFYHNVNNLNLQIGDYVAVEGTPGHDIGVVSLTNEIIFEQLKKNRVSLDSEFKKVYRKAKPTDIEKWREAIVLEHATMLESRKLARDMGLNMKIGDVEFQGDKTKAIFYYIADERVDFRQLIKVLAEQYRIRIEMRQIGARQEAGRIGGIGSCGRELCCSTWIGNFVSVATNAARVQELSLNPQKLAGQCSKLKCCLNYELDSYLDARREFPNTEIILRTKEGNANHVKTDVYKGIMWYGINSDNRHQIVPLTTSRVIAIIKANRKDILPDKLIDKDEAPAIPLKEVDLMDYQNVVGQESMDRFNKPKSKRKDNRPRNKGRNYNNLTRPNNRNKGDNTSGESAKKQ